MADKLVVAVWTSEKWDPARLRTVLLDEVAPVLLKRVAGLSMMIRDERAAEVPSPSPFPLGVRKPVALVNAWGAGAAEVLEPLRAAGLVVHAWSVEESVYTDYGGNAHAEPRDWPDGQRSPGVVVVSFLERPRRMDRDLWVERWHGRISPVSERIQPRQRYVRNLLVTPCTSDPPPFEGIVEEVFADARTIQDPYRFYGAQNTWQLVKHMGEIIVAVMAFTWLWRVQPVVMSEYFLRTP